MHTSLNDDSTIRKFIQTLQDLPPEVNLLHMKDCLKTLDCEGIIKVLGQLPTQIRALTFKWSQLDTRDDSELELIFRSITPHIVSLDLTGNNLSSKNVSILKAIPPGITALNFSWNNLGDKTSADFAEFLNALPDSTTQLDLSSNELYRFDKAFISIFSRLNPRVTTLNLSFNDLGYLGLIPALIALPVSVTTADLSSNDFCTPGEEELTSSYPTHTPSNLTSLDLQLNNPNKSPLLNLTTLKGYLPHLKSISLSSYAVEEMTEQQIKALKEMAPNITEWDFFDKYGNEIQSTQPALYASLLSKMAMQKTPPPPSEYQFFVAENKKRKLASNSSEEEETARHSETL